ncbi:MAG: hypothetical protein EOO39_11990 [Cytophagaceae bacterium]|nr:MAG: hypothetical protein EOO39_11990 [Cytophagaceae bacterium]
MTLPKRLAGGLTIMAAVSCLTSCRVTAPQGSLEPDFYQIIHAPQTDMFSQKVYVLDASDSIQLINPRTDQRQFIAGPAYKSWTFQRAEVDVDVFTLPFKIRPAQGMLPGQLNSNFNAALYVGRRIDLYNYRWKPITPTYAVRQLQSRGFGYGFFTGIGSVTINDFVTRLPIGIEYEGVVINAGIATIYDARIFNIGLAVGLDHLMDANRQQWIYQQKPWFGVLFGLNLN